MKNTVPLLAVAATLLFTACEKTDDKTFAETCNLSKIFITNTDGSKGSIVMEYDSLNNPGRVHFYNDSIQDAYRTILYNDYGIIAKEHAPGTDVSVDDITSYSYSHGQVVSAMSSVDHEDNGYIYTTKSTYVYEYNDDGYMGMSKQVRSYTSTDPGFQPYKITAAGTYTYTDSNLTAYHYTEGNYSYDITYTYYKDRLSDRFTQYDLGEDKGVALFSGMSKNQVRSTTKIFNTSASWKQEFTYTYNAKGYVSQRIAIGKNSETDNDTSRSETTFEYICR